jgi:O-antigen ligase
VSLSLKFLLLFIAVIPFLGLPGQIILRPIPDLMLLGVLGSWIYLSIKNKKTFFTGSSVKTWLWGFIAVSLFSGLFAIQTDLWLGNILGLFAGLLFFNIFRAVIKDEKNHAQIINASLWGLGIALFFGLLQLLLYLEIIPMLPFTHFLLENSRLPRLCATFIDSINFAAYLAILYPFLLNSALTEKNSQKKWLWALLIVLFVVVGLMTQSRALLASVGIVTFISSFYLKKYFFPLGFLALFVILVMNFFTPQTMQLVSPKFAIPESGRVENYDKLFVQKGLKIDRLEMWNETLHYLTLHPMGVGAGNSARILPEKYQSLYGKGTPGPHNIFLGFTVELGWGGGIFFLSFMVWILCKLNLILWNMRKPKKAFNALYLSRLNIFGALTGFLIYHQFVDSYVITPNVFYFWILLTLISQTIDAEQGKIKGKTR